MNFLRTGSLACLFLFTIPACGLLGGGNEPTKSVAPGAMNAGSVDIGKLLGGITDGATANAAKGPLEGAIAQLKNALSGATANAGGSADMAKKMAGDVLAKFGIGAGTLGTITNLMNNEAIKGAIGPMLAQLKSLIPAM
jgi:hypothetical protein